MSLPEIFLPSGLPRLLAEGHAIAPAPVFADVPMQAGHARRRRLHTVAPRVVDASLVLTNAQAAVFDDWFESVLLAGERRFSVQAAGQGGGLLWWASSWVAPPSMEPMPGGTHWRVTGQLLLTGEGTADSPYTPDLAVTFTAALTGSASLSVTPALSVEFVAALTQPIVLGSIDFVVALEPVVTWSLLLLESGDRVLLESGGGIVLED